VNSVKVHSTSFGLAHKDGSESHDAFAVKSWDDTLVAVLADGAGSAKTAREAAQRAVRSFLNHYETRPRTWPPPKALAEFTRLINRALHQDSLARFGEPELVTTLSVAVLEGGRLYGLNVGDSRVYLARKGNLTRLSQDHIAENNGLKHVLGRALGLAAEVEPHQFEQDLCDGDMALLCSDGISNVLDDTLLAETLGRRSAARSVVYTARERATEESIDDMSAIVLDIENTIGLSSPSNQPPPQIPSKLRKGEVIDGFTLVRQFQESERVWLATKEGQRFTLKFAPVEALESEELAALFSKETLNAARLQNTEFFPHAFVPEEAKHRFYAMEFIEAPSLKTLLRSRSLSIDEAVALGKFLLAAAQYLLRFDLVHGDFKPENILVLSGYDRIRFKLIDFGSVTELFSTASRAGTASYLAPERFHEASISERTELFAMGVTLFEAVTRAFPFGEIERFQTPRFHHVKKPTVLNPNLPPWFEAVLLRAVSPSPERRYQNYSEMLFDLDHPEQVAPFRLAEVPLFQRDPLLFYKTGFFLLLAVTLVLLIFLLKR
jgi:serine/threonine protein phosphatase PrpC